MAHIYGNIDSETDLERVFREIHKDVDGAKSTPSLTELYKRASYLITLTYAPSWAEKIWPRGQGIARGCRGSIQDHGPQDQQPSKGDRNRCRL